MEGNLLTTLLALFFYMSSSLFGGGSGSSAPSEGYTPDRSGQLYPKSAVVSTKQASVRSLPSTDGKITATVAQGAGLVLLDKKGSWYKVQTDTGAQGWVADWLVTEKSYAGSSAAGSRKTIAAYYVENYRNDPVGYTALSQNLTSINMIIPFSFNVDGYGNVRSTHNPRPVALARSAGASTLALVNNINGSNFNSNTVHRLLTNSAARSRAVQAIKRTVVENGYRGVNIDFENVPSRDRIYLTAFFRELAAAFRPMNLLVTASVPAKTYDEKKSSHSGAYDYKALAPYLDQVMVMTYDEHYSGGPAGPVASYPWVEKVINYTMQSFPAYKIVLGLAGYGYDWGWRSGKAVHYNAIQKLIKSHKAAPKWHSTYKVPYFTYRSWGVTHQVWYENAHSTAAKMQLVRKYALKGVAVWRLGYEDPNIWKVIKQGF